MKMRVPSAVPVLMEDKASEILAEELKLATLKYTRRLMLNDNIEQDSVFSVVLMNIIIAMVEDAMKVTGGNQSKAAEILGISRATIRSYLLRYFNSVDIGTIKME